MEHPCPMCDGSYSQHCHLRRHVQTAHAGLWTCKDCSQTFNREDNFHYHQRTCTFLTTGVRPLAQSGSGNLENIKRRKPRSSALNGTCQVFTKDLDNETQTPSNIFTILKEAIVFHKATLLAEREEKKAIKFSFNLRLLFHQASEETVLTDPPVELNSKTQQLLAADNLDELLTSAFDELVKRIEKYQSRGSGWTLHKLVKLDLHVDQFDPLRASSYIPTPLYIEKKKAVVNVNNSDN